MDFSTISSCFVKSVDACEPAHLNSTKCYRELQMHDYVFAKLIFIIKCLLLLFIIVLVDYSVIFTHDLHLHGNLSAYFIHTKSCVKLLSFMAVWAVYNFMHSRFSCRCVCHAVM